MNMRLDYPLYGLAVVSFILSATLFAVLGQQDGQLLYAASVAVLGLFFVAGGYFVRPKSKPMPTFQTPSAPPAVAEPVQQEATVKPVTLESLKMDHQTTSAVETASPIEATKVEAPSVKAPIVTYAQPTTLVLAGSANIAAADMTTPAQPIETAVPKAESTNTSDVRKIRGINENRASQLRANGIVTITDLAQASPTDLAAKLEVSEKIVKMWVGSAKKLTK